MINMIKVANAHYTCAIPYYVCDTAAATVDKVLSDVAGIDADHPPLAGMQLKIRFSLGSTCANSTFLVINGLPKSWVNMMSSNPLEAGEIISIAFNGNNWERI